MKQTFLFLLALTLFATRGTGQTIIRYTPSTNTSYAYNNLDTAYHQAQNDDYLYLSGNTFFLNTNALTKKLHWIGAGVHTDSTLATGTTRLMISGIVVSLIVRPTASGSTFTGIDFGNFRLNDCDVAGDVNLVTFVRCKFSSDWINLGHAQSGYSIYYYFRECIFNTFVGGDPGTNFTANITFDNCIFSKSLFRMRKGSYTYNNCIFWASIASDGIAQNYGCAFNNCIFWNGASSNLFSGGFMEQGNIFANCVFSHATIPVGSAGTLPTVISNCIANVTSLFVNTNGNFIYEDADNYHLVTGSPALTAGAGGTQCGIYGGTTAAKNGFVPFNPHISNKTIAPASTNGMLNVTINATSQTY